jgi:iron complex outermembrane receptor protein
MRFFILLISILLFSDFVSSQTRMSISLSGIIADASTGLPLSGASVSITDARMGDVADSTGRYLLRNVPTGHHLIEISHTGYTTIVEHIDVASSMEKNFRLVRSVVENQGVTVTGVTSATSTRNTPISVVLIRKTQLLQTPSTNIIDALSKQPGISQISTGPAISKPVIRGLGYNRVVVMNDGARQEGQQWGDEHGIEIDEASVNRAEILKGPASIMYGSDALAGVIHFITNTPAPEGAVRGNLFTNYQTNNGQVGLNGSLQGAKNGFNWNVYGSSKSAKDYKNKYDGRVLNSRFNEKNYGGYIGLNKSWGFSHLIFSSFNQNIGLVEGERDENTGEFIVNAGSPLERIATSKDLDSRELFTPKQNVRHYKIMSDNSFVIGESRLKLNVGFQNNLRKEFGNPEDPSETELYFDLKTVNYNLQWRLPEVSNLETTIGISGMQQSNRNKGEEAIIPAYSFFDVGGFLFAQKTFTDIVLSGGLRFDNRSINSKELREDADVKFSSFKKTFSTFSGSAGLSYSPTDMLTFKVNAARGFRAPTLSELASNGAHEGTNRYEFGQLDLDAEKSLQLDAGVDMDYEHVSFSLSAFYNRINDFIFYRRLESASGSDSLIIVDGEELDAFQYNQNNAKLSGLEASIDIHPHPLDWLHFNNTLSLVKGRFDEAVDGSNRLPGIPSARYISEIKANFTKGQKTIRNLYLLVEMDKTFDQKNPFTGYNTETKTKGYTLINAGIGMDLFRKDKTIFNIHIAANNLADVAYQNHLSRLKYAALNNATGRTGVYNMGRNFSVKVNVPFSF